MPASSVCKFTVLILFALIFTSCEVENINLANSPNKNTNQVQKANANHLSEVTNANKNTQSANANLNTDSSTNANSNPSGNTNSPPAPLSINEQSAEKTEIQAPAGVISIPKLIIPVEGIKKEQLQDVFTQSRSEGRVHNAIDIMAAEGTPIYAATDGKIIKFHDSVRGGITTYQLATDERLVLYYAHLKSRAENVKEGDFVKRGTLLGYVGDTGNSGTGNFHLHFAMWIITDPKRFWTGENINPYIYLR